MIPRKGTESVSKYFHFVNYFFLVNFLNDSPKGDGKFFWWFIAYHLATPLYFLNDSPKGDGKLMGLTPPIKHIYFLNDSPKGDGK